MGPRDRRRGSVYVKLLPNVARLSETLDQGLPASLGREANLETLDLQLVDVEGGPWV